VLNQSSVIFIVRQLAYLQSGMGRSKTGELLDRLGY
jgi:hypothetical protein